MNYFANKFFILPILTISISLTVTSCIGTNSNKGKIKKENVKTETAVFIKQFKQSVIRPGINSFDSQRVYNPTLTILDNKLYMIYRTEDIKTVSGIICLAKGTNAESFKQYDKNPILKSSEQFDIFGCEGPKLTNFEKNYYLYYVGNNKNPSQICVAISTNLTEWTKLGLIMEPKYEWEKNKIKSPTPIPIKINNKYFMYYLGQEKSWHTSIGLAVSEDHTKWKEALFSPILKPRKNYFDNTGIEPGVCVEIPNKNLLLLIYNGWDESKIIKTGWALYDKKEPSRLISRCDTPIISTSDKSVFASAMIEYNNKWYIYWSVDDYEIQGGEFDMKEFLQQSH